MCVFGSCVCLSLSCTGLGVSLRSVCACEAREVTGRRTAQENSRKNAHDALTKHHITLQGG